MLAVFLNSFLQFGDHRGLKGLTIVLFSSHCVVLATSYCYWLKWCTGGIKQTAMATLSNYQNSQSALTHQPTSHKVESRIQSRFMKPYILAFADESIFRNHLSLLKPFFQAWQCRVKLQYSKLWLQQYAWHSWSVCGGGDHILNAWGSIKTGAAEAQSQYEGNSLQQKMDRSFVLVICLPDCKNLEYEVNSIILSWAAFPAAKKTHTQQPNR